MSHNQYDILFNVLKPIDEFRKKALEENFKGLKCLKFNIHNNFKYLKEEQW